jgi:hypothetical protein
MTLEISELLLPAIVIQILQSIKELVCHTFDNKNCIPKLALEIQDLSLLALLDNSNTTSFDCHAFLLANFWYLHTTIFEDNFHPHPKVPLHTSNVTQV